jgi:hypothetical protein
MRICYGHSICVSALEIFAAKEAKRRFDCCGKHLDCQGDCYLSPGRVEDYSTDEVAIGQRRRGNAPDADSMGNRLAGNGRYSRGKTGPT